MFIEPSAIILKSILCYFIRLNILYVSYKQREYTEEIINKKHGINQQKQWRN